MRQFAFWGATFLFVASLCPLASFAQNADVVAIQELQVSQADAWNHHDASAYSDLFAQDGDVVNVQGWWWKGRNEIAQKLSAAFAYVFRESRLTITDVQVRLLNKQFALAHVRWTMEGGKTPPGALKPPHEGIQLQVLRKEKSRWRITSLQNTNSVPETDFPRT